MSKKQTERDCVKVDDVQVSERGKPGRLVSLDAFRGLTIALMLLVNNVALDTATPKQLMHAPWNAGIRLADFVFPWFLFCVGAAIPFAASSFRRKGLAAWRYDVKALGRAASLVAFGCLIDSSLYKQPIFDLGVLQLIGLAYLVGAVLYALPFSWRMVAAAALLVGYWLLIKFVAVPGAGVGVFEEQRNIIAHVNRTYLSSLHLAGLLSVIPTSAMVLIGTAIGDTLRREVSHGHRIGVLTISGVALMVAGFVWNLNLPFNKPVWTPSYILFTAGAGSLVLGVMYAVIDTRGWKWWSFPLVVFGSNAILAYIAPILVKVHALQEWSVPIAAGKSVTVQQWWLDSFVAHFGRIPGGWAYTLSYIVAWWVVLFVFYRKKIFLRV